PRPAVHYAVPSLRSADLTAAASCASRRSSHCTYVPRPGGTLCATTSKTPPTESPVRNTLSTSSFIRSSASGSAQLSNTLSLLQLDRKSVVYVKKFKPWVA